MKKNRMMRLASALLVLVLLTTCAISGTFAKYITTAGGTDVARVAKWGVQIEGIANNLYAKTYAADDNDTEIVNTVEATVEVVAPGTKNDEGVSFSLTGTPEVAVQIDIVVKGSTGDTISDVVLPAGTYTNPTGIGEANFTIADPGYYPVVYTLKDGNTVLATGNLAAIEEFLEGKSGEYDPGTDLKTILAEEANKANATGEYTLTWAWAFENAGKDPADTYLGNVAAEITEDNGVSTTIDFAIVITATQID